VVAQNNQTTDKRTISSHRASVKVLSDRCSYHAHRKGFPAAWLGWCRARQLTDEQRAAVANYFSIYKGTENGMAKLMVPASGVCQPSLERALDFIKDAWEEV